MTKNTYFRIRLNRVPNNFEDIITTHCFEFGATGVTEALQFSQPDLTYDPDIINPSTHDLDVFFTERPSEEFFSKLLDYNSNIQWQIVEEENKDWLEEWKKGFKPFKLVGPYWIVPSWLTPPEECKKPIYIDPGMAFGTGTHATTQMAAFFIQKLSEKHVNDLAQWSLMDVGTGTAILAILAQMNGFKSVEGIEIDPEARRTARENIKLNKVEKIQITDHLLEEVRSTYDVVIANIIDGVLINLKEDLIRIVKPNGYLFLTGILEERDNLFFEKFIENSNLEVIRRLEKDEWVGYWLKKLS